MRQREIMRKEKREKSIWKGRERKGEEEGGREWREWKRVEKGIIERKLEKT